MDTRRVETRMNAERDRLSALPDELIHKILSFTDIKDAIGTSVLSSKWRYIWKSMPYLTFSVWDFTTLPKFSKFVTNVFSRRNNITEVYSLKLHFRLKASHLLLKRILNYVFSHNIQKLDVVCVIESHIQFPLTLFSSMSLKHLSLTMQPDKSRFPHVNCYLTSTWELPSLTTLHLHSVTLYNHTNDVCGSVFSKCANLKTLSLNKVNALGSQGLRISHPRLSNLTFENCSPTELVIHVAAPQLENLTIRFCDAKHFKISAPNLVSLALNSFNPMHIFTEGFRSLKKADICISSPQEAHAPQIVRLLQLLHSVKFLNLNWKIIAILSSNVDQKFQQPSPFVSLNNLKLYPERVYWCFQAPKTQAMSTELKSYLLGGSSTATLTMVLPEEVQAQKLLAEIRMLIENENNNFKITMARIEREKTHVESHEPKKPAIGGHMAQIKNCLEMLGVQLQHRKKFASLIITKLQVVEELIASLPASNKAKIEPCLISLRAQAGVTISKIIDCMKIHCDESQIRSSVLFCEPATTLEPSL